MKNSRGVSLVELLLALSACGVILTLSAGLIERIMKAELRARDYARVERTAIRLANTFRHDTWQAREAVFFSGDRDPGQVLRLSLNDTASVEYRQQSGAVVRTVFDGQDVLGNETFVFPKTVEIDIQQTAPVLLALTIHAPPEVRASSQGRPHDAYAPPIALEVLARLSRDGAFQWNAPALGGQP